VTDAADAIEALQAEEKSRKENCEKCADATRRVIIDLQGIIADLRAQLPKRGEWLEREVIHDRADAKITDWQQAKCSLCNKWHTTPYLYSFNDYNYCPNCGAKMIG
jgi:Zn finger protein HypA/HybF involved in hydrogenase expression